MATESVKLIIGARDTASSVLGGVGNSITGVQGKITGLGAASKRGGLDIQYLLSQMKGSQLSGFAAQIQKLIPLLNKLKLGAIGAKAGALALRAGLLSAAAAGGFKFGQWLVGAKKQLEQFEAAMQKSREQVDQFRDAADRVASNQQFDLSLIKDPAAKKKALEDMLQNAQKNLAGTAGDAAYAKKQFDEMNTTFKSWTGNKVLALTKEQADQAAAAVVEKKKAWMDLQDQLDHFNKSEQVRIQAERDAGEADRVQSIFDVIAATKEQADTLGLTNAQLQQYKLFTLDATDAEKELLAIEQKALDAKQKAIDLDKEKQRIAEVDKSALDTLRQQIVLLREGEEAAAQLADKADGLSGPAQKQAALYRDQIAALKERNKLEDDAKSIIDENKTAFEKFVDEHKKLMKLKVEGLIDPETFARALDKARAELANSEDGGQQKSKEKSDLQAVESRFLTRGRGVDVGKQQLAVTLKTSVLTQRMKDILEALAQNLPPALAAIVTNTANNDEVLN